MSEDRGAEPTDPSGRYRQMTTELLCSEVGKGSKHVFKAYDTETAVELAWVEYWNMPVRCLNAFEAKKELLKSIDHPHIVKYYEAWVDKKNKKVTVITEAMPTQGKSNVSNLKRFLTRALQMKPNVLKRWLLQVLSGLHFLHSLKDESGNPSPFVHLDLRCDNIFIRPNTSNLKIGALELSIFISNSHPSAFDGTPGFMPPELHKQSAYDVKTDIYAFGMAALEMFTKATPYSECTSSIETFLRQLQGQPPQAYLKLAKEATNDPEIMLQLQLIEKCVSPYENRWLSGELFTHTYFLDVYLQTEFSPDEYGLSAVTVAQIQAMRMEEHEKPPQADAADVAMLIHSTWVPIDIELRSGGERPNSTPSSLNSSMQSLHAPNDAISPSPESSPPSPSKDEKPNETPQPREMEHSDRHYMSVLKCDQQECRKSIKCFYPGTAHMQLHLAEDRPQALHHQECVRVYFDEVSSVSELSSLLSDDLQFDEDSCKFKYLDEEGDLVSFKSRTCLDELRSFAISIHVYPKPSALSSRSPPITAFIPIAADD